MNDGKLSINFYFCNLMADERQRGSHEIVQSRVNRTHIKKIKSFSSIGKKTYIQTLNERAQMMDNPALMNIRMLDPDPKLSSFLNNALVIFENDNFDN